MTSSLSKRTANRQRWFDHIEAWQQSGLTQKAFCKQQQLRLGSFLRWRGICKRERESQRSTTMTFLPVNITVPEAASLALLLGDELRIEIPVGFDPATLTQVIQTLRAS